MKKMPPFGAKQEILARRSIESVHPKSGRRARSIPVETSPETRQTNFNLNNFNLKK
jgi:hypothetical protein